MYHPTLHDCLSFGAFSHDHDLPPKNNMVGLLKTGQSMISNYGIEGASSLCI